MSEAAIDQIGRASRHKRVDAPERARCLLSLKSFAGEVHPRYSPSDDLRGDDGSEEQSKEDLIGWHPHLALCGISLIGESLGDGGQSLQWVETPRWCHAQKRTLRETFRVETRPT